MKKHLLLILALLAFVLPARAQSDPDMLYNFKNNSTSSDYGTNFNTSVDIDNVIANVTGVDVTDGGANAKNYVSAITEATNVAYNSKGGVYMKAGGKLTFTLKKGYKVTGYQFMGQQLNGTTATITLNGISFNGPTNTQAEGQFSRLYPVPSSVTTVNSITISSNKDVYIKSVGIYIEADASTLTVNVAPPAGSYKVGQVVMASANNTSANVQMIISKIEGNNYTEISKTTTTGYNSYTFSEAGKYQVIAQAYTGNWQTTSNYFCEEYTIVGDEPDPTPATLSVNLATGTYKLPQTVTITSSKADDDIIVILTDENKVEVVNNTFTGSWTYNFTTPGTFALSALNNDESTISEIYKFGYAPETPVFSKDNGAYTSGTEITVSSKYATQLAVKVIKKADYDTNGFNATGTQTIYDANSHTLTLTEDVVIVAQGKNDFGTTSTDYRIYTISNPVKPNVAPVITFSHEDQKVFGSEEEIDVTLNLNHDVYPVPNVIYYTLDGFMAHNTLETGTPGATPAGHVLTVDVDPATLSGTVRIECSHREALNHRAVTINAYAVNTAGSDVAAATYIFNGSTPEPETEVQATFTVANQNWTAGRGKLYGKDNTSIDWVTDNNDNSVALTLSTLATVGKGGTYPTYYTNSPVGLRLYGGTNENTITVTAPTGYYFKSVKPTYNIQSDGSGKLSLDGTTIESNTERTYEGNTTTSIVFSNLVTTDKNQVAITKVEFVFGKTDVATTAVAPATIKAAANATEITAEQINAAGTVGDNKTVTVSGFSFYFEKNGGSSTPTYNSSSKEVRIYTKNKFTIKSSTAGQKISNISMTISSDKDPGDVTSSPTGVTHTTTSVTWSGSAEQVVFTMPNTTGKQLRLKTISITLEGSGPVIETVATPEITLSTQAKPSDPVTVTISCATADAVIEYSLDNGSTWTKYTSLTVSDPGTYTVKARASKEGMNTSEVATSAQFTITEPEVPAEPVEELFFVMDQNLWDVDGAYPETVVPFEYKGNNTYDLEITKIPAKGWYMNKNGIWTAIEHGFRGNFYVRDGKANRKGLVFGATGTVADATFATRAAAAGNQMVEPHTKYNMYVVNEGETHKVFTTIDGNISKAFSAGTIRVTHTPGNKDAAKTMTLEILAEDNQTTGVDSITAEDAASDANARFFNLQGVEVPADRLAPGIYIRQAGSKATKVLVK